MWNKRLHVAFQRLIDWLIDYHCDIIQLRLNASGQRVKIIILTNNTSFWPWSVSLNLSLPRKLIGLLDPSSPVRLMAATWRMPDCGWWRPYDCFWFCFMPIRRAMFALVSALLSLSAGAVTYSTLPSPLPTLVHSLPPPYAQAAVPIASV